MNRGGASWENFLRVVQRVRQAEKAGAWDSVVKGWFTVSNMLMDESTRSMVCGSMLQDLGPESEEHLYDTLLRCVWHTS